jgi:hypothetical protein
MSKQMSAAAQQFTNLLVEENELYKKTLQDFASHPMPDYMVMAKARETLARGGAMMANMGADQT